jgi:hypothetical protein
MTSVTLDTNLVDNPQLLAAARTAGFQVAHTTVTDRELSGSGVVAAEGRCADLIETGIVGESIVGLFVIGGMPDATNIDQVLEIISSGSFPRGKNRKHLSDGQRRQVRDAMIFCTHIREKRDLFVTNDRRGFIDNGRREFLENRFTTKIYTAEEFLLLCNVTCCDKN